MVRLLAPDRRPTMTAVVVVDWRTLTAVDGPFIGVEAARVGLYAALTPVNTGHLGVVAVPVAWLPHLPRHLGDWLASAPDRYAAELAARAESLPELEEVPA